MDKGESTKIKKENKMHSRDYAVQVYNMICDYIDLEEEERIKPSIEPDERKMLVQNLEFGFITPEEYDKELEKSDSLREKLIKAIRTGKLVFDEEKANGKDENTALSYKLNTPIKNTKTGETILDLAVFKKRYKVKDADKNLIGINLKNPGAQKTAMIASRIGVYYGIVSEMYSDDSAVCESVELLFRAAEL